MIDLGQYGSLSEASIANLPQDLGLTPRDLRKSTARSLAEAGVKFFADSANAALNDAPGLHGVGLHGVGLHDIHVLPPMHNSLLLDISQFVVVIQNVEGRCKRNRNFLRLSGKDLGSHTTVEGDYTGWFPDAGEMRWGQITRSHRDSPLFHLPYLRDKALFITYSCYEGFALDRQQQPVCAYQKRHSAITPYALIYENGVHRGDKSDYTDQYSKANEHWPLIKAKYQYQYCCNRIVRDPQRSPDAFVTISCATPLYDFTPSDNISVPSLIVSCFATIDFIYRSAVSEDDMSLYLRELTSRIHRELDTLKLIIISHLARPLFVTQYELSLRY